MDRKYFMDNLKHISDIHGINVDDETIDKFINASIFRIISKGEVIASIGDNTTMAGLVLSGITRCYYIDNNGNDITRGFDTAGYLCMDEGLYGYSKRICMWEVLEESTIMFCETSIVKKFMHENNQLKDVWITLLERALQYKIYRENTFLVENATERYIHFKKLYPDLYNIVPQKHIATYLGITPESLSRIRSAMKDNKNN